MVHVSVQHLLEKLFRSTVSLPPAEWGPGVSGAHRHSGVPWARLVPRWANLGVKLPPIIWDPGHGAEPLFTSVSMPVKWGNESCYLRGLWGPHCMAVKQVPQPLSQA